MEITQRLPKMGGFEMLNGEIPPYLSTFVLSGQNSTNVTSNTMSICWKSVETPIQSGGSMTGLLCFILPNVSERTASEHENKVVVCFEDVTGRRYVISKTVGPTEWPM
jgi:hypothetical protein